MWLKQVFPEINILTENKIAMMSLINKHIVFLIRFSHIPLFRDKQIL